MAMAMATTVTAPGTRICSPVHTASRPSSTASASCSVSHLCSSFTGLSIQTWRRGSSSSRHAGDITGLSDISPAPNGSTETTTTRKLVFTVAKLKTHKASAKRFKVTASGKIMRRRACKQHLLRKKSSNRKRRLSKMVQVNRRDYDNVIGALPYLKVKGRLT